ncbi:hypothetical protein C4J90_4308 [Pseudomonas sp. R2-60-08W]|nr:hypothetical protein C4J90_4308 [Pseudomonas sp. R2-60-08W]
MLRVLTLGMEPVPVSTSTPPPSFDEIKGSLNLIGHHLLKVDTPLLPDQKASTELAYLERLNVQLKQHREQYLRKGRALYQALTRSNLASPEGQTLLSVLKTTLNTRLQALDLREQIDGKSQKSFMTYEAGYTALTHEAALGEMDRLLHPQERAMLDRLPLGPTQRPGQYALTMEYQDQTVELAGAFVLTEKSSPVVSEMTANAAVGRVLLFTPSRGIETFDSLTDLNTRLRSRLDNAGERHEVLSLLAVRYHAITPEAIWPLTLAPIDDAPLFEHTYNALITKRGEDIDRALSLVNNPHNDAGLLMDALDRAITDALPDLTARFEWRAQVLLDRWLRHSAPDWYRSANEARRTTLADHLRRYNEARQHLLDLLGPVTTPHALARYQWLERLSDDLEIHDLDPQRIEVNTRRVLDPIGEYEHDRSLVELALRGPHTGDENVDSDFLKKTTLTYNGAALEQEYNHLTPAWLLEQLGTLQPRIDFGDLQKQMHSKPEVSRAIEAMLDLRINALAYAALLQGHLSENDYSLIQSLRQGTGTGLSASTVSLHEAQLQDLWVLRQRNAEDVVIRVLLCTPEAAREQQFQAFNSDAACQSHVLGWALDNGIKTPPGTLTDYLINRVALRFRNTMTQVLRGLSFKPQDLEHEEVTFSPSRSHADCLKDMAAHVLATRVDDYEFSTPGWYRSAPADTRRKLLKLAEDAEGGLRTYNDFPLSEASVPTFTDYLHEQAKIRLNTLLGHPRNAVDPDTVWAYSPPSLKGTSTPAPISYTQLYRDGYADGIGFLDEKFSRSARFKGPDKVDLSLLTAENVARSVTGVWIGQRYTNEIKARLLNAGSPDYDLRRNATLVLAQTQMQNAALECQLQGHIASVDLPWLERSIATMGSTSAQTRLDYAIHRLMIDGDWVIGTYLFSHGDNPTLLYTPNAPDGIRWREAKLFNYLLIKTPGMIQYLIARVPTQSRIRVQAFLEKAKEQLPEHLDRTTVSPARYDSTHAQAPLLDLRKDLYNMKLQRIIDDVAATTVNRTHMITEILWTCVEWVTAIATAPFPILSLSAGLLLAFKDGMLALHAYHQGDNAKALEHFMGYLLNSAGAVFTDLRPALDSVKRLSQPPKRLANTPSLKLISPLEPTPLAPAGMQSAWFNGELLWAPKTPDPIGRYLLYRLDPATGKLVSTTRLAAPDAQGVWKRTGVTGGAPKYEKVAESPDRLKNYEIPAKYQGKMQAVVNPNSKEMLTAADDWLDDPGLMRDLAAMDLKKAHTVYQQQVNHLTNDAQDFFNARPLGAPRVEVPAVEVTTDVSALTDSALFTANPNLVIGAVPGSIASKQLLIENMDALIKKGFRRLYVEYLPNDVFREKLKKLNRGGSWRNIKQHLKAIDKALGFAEDARFSYVGLVHEAQKKGLKVRALDASTSYQLDDMLSLGDTPPTTPRDSALRNFYSHKVLEADIEDLPDERWIALVDPARMTTFNQKPGLADLHKAVAMRVEDVGLDQPVGIWVDSPGNIAGDALAKGDYRLTMQTPYKAVEQPGPSAAAALPAVGHYSEYDIAPSLRDSIRTQSQQPYGLDTHYVPGPSQREAFFAFKSIRERLHKDAKQFLSSHELPARPDLSALGTKTQAEPFLETLNKSTLPGLVIGEAHEAQSSKAFLIKHMKKLKALEVKTLYVEHLLTDLHQADLDTFFRTAHMPRNLQSYLRSQDVGHMPLYSGPNTYSQVIQAANKYGIRVRALDCSASYHVKGAGSDARNEMFNYFASRVINADQAANGPHKWVAFIGSGHTNTFQQVPGLAQLQGAVSLHIRDVAPSLSSNIRPGRWETNLETRWTALRSDFTLNVGVPGKHEPAAFVPLDRTRLKATGHFLVEHPSMAETNLLHKSRSGEIVSTPIQVDDQGMFYIDRWDMAQQRFVYQTALIDAIRDQVKLIPAPY